MNLSVPTTYLYLQYLLFLPNLTIILIGKLKKVLHREIFFLDHNNPVKNPF